VGPAGEKRVRKQVQSENHVRDKPRAKREKKDAGAKILKKRKRIYHCKKESRSNAHGRGSRDAVRNQRTERGTEQSEKGRREREDGKKGSNKCTLEKRGEFVQKLVEKRDKE